MTLKAIELQTSPNQTVSVIWMHGLGANSKDFLPIVRELDMTGVPGIRFVFPQAPMLPVTINGGRIMPAWFDICSSEFGSGDDEKTLRNSQADINTLIEREKERGIPTDKILLAGFSQGCAMTLQTGLRHPEKLGGLICLSGYLPLESSFEAERTDANKNIPIYYGHGIGDQVIPIKRAQQSLGVLQKLGYDVDWHKYNMPHLVCMEEIIDISKFLKKVLK